jgi:hypothetical protein
MDKTNLAPIMGQSEPAATSKHIVKDGWDKLNLIWKFDQPTYYPSSSEIEIIVKIQLSSCLEYSLFLHTLISRIIHLFIYIFIYFSSSHFCDIVENHQ